ncbi:DUF378 domain-containing protein [Zhenpiania hominis]|uniref:DUF378 domain-containing protein n=1 Tax=Zhenpiania hominis TaxID=2763644 RepID=UPI002FB2407F
MISLRNLILALIIIGAINWGLIGFFQYDLVSSIFGPDLQIISRIIFAIVGLAGLYAISFFFRNGKNSV